MSVAKFYLSPFGRLSRKGYWLGVALPLTALYFTMSFGGEWIERQLGTPYLGELLPNLGIYPDTPVSYLVADVILIWPSFATYVRRLHDLGVSGWWAATSVPVYVSYIDSWERILTNWAGMIALAAYVLLLTILTVVTLFMRGNASPNAFGPPPTPPVIFGKARGALQT